jgi:hypothetical protein
MSQAELYKIKQEVKEKQLAQIRYQWFKEYQKTKNVCTVCSTYGISRSVFYYWKNRVDLPPSRKGKGYARYLRCIAYSRKPQTNPKMYPAEVVCLIIKIRKRTNRGAEYIWFMLRDRYAIYVSVSGIYKVLKREGLITERHKQRKRNTTYEAPKYLPGEKVQIDVKYVQLKDACATRLNKAYRWVYQYTAIDIATGIKCKMIFEHRDGRSSVDFLARVRLFYPFPLKVIQTDNGLEFTWRLQPISARIHPFTQQCALYGYDHHLIPPAYPRANSHVERTHRIDQEEVYRGRTFTSLPQLHTVSLKSLKYFNEKRPQKSKHFLAPLTYGILTFQLHIQSLNYTVLNV